MSLQCQNIALHIAFGLNNILNLTAAYLQTITWGLLDATNCSTLVSFILLLGLSWSSKDFNPLNTLHFSHFSRSSVCPDLLICIFQMFALTWPGIALCSQYSISSPGNLLFGRLCSFIWVSVLEVDDSAQCWSSFTAKRNRRGKKACGKSGLKWNMRQSESSKGQSIKWLLCSCLETWVWFRSCS